MLVVVFLYFSLVVLMVLGETNIHLLFLLQLDRPAILNEYVDLAQLPTPSEYLAPYSVCTVSGWGVTSIFDYYLSPVLRAVDVSIIPYCQYYYWGMISENMICAGSPYGGKDSCQVHTWTHSYSATVAADITFNIFVLIKKSSFVNF